MTFPFRLMGIVNVTPDSFSDGGASSSRGGDRARPELVAQGAEILDVGGESTRPGAEPVSARARSCARVLPVIEGLAAARTGAQISIDTSKAAVAARGAAARARASSTT